MKMMLMTAVLMLCSALNGTAFALETVSVNTKINDVTLDILLTVSRHTGQ